MKLFFSLLVLLFLQSCTLIVFKKPLPLNEENIDAFPENYRGEYLHGTDTLEICARSVKVYDDSISEYILSNSLILRKFDGDYYVNYQLDGFWLVSKCTFYETDSVHIRTSSPVFGMRDEVMEANTKKAVKGLRKLTRAKQKDGHVVLNPRKRHLDRVFDSEYFENYMTLKRIK